MKDAIKRLKSSIQDMNNLSQLSISSNDIDLDTESVGDLSNDAEIFEQIFGYPCPESLKVGLFLPDTLSLNWKFNDKISGEFSLSNIFLSMYRVLDESLQPWTMHGMKLADTRIVDQVLLNGGPFYTLIQTSKSGMSEQLYVFDTRDIVEIELNYEEYLEKISLTKGVIYWQYLFGRDLRLRGFEKALLKREISFLESMFPEHDYQELWTKWFEKSS